VLANPDESVRFWAVKALGQIPERRKTVTVLRGALNDQDRNVRRVAIEGLARIGGARATEAVLGALEDRDRDVRAAAASSLTTMGPAALDAVFVALRDCESRTGRKASAEALGKLEDPRVRPALVEALDDPAVSVRETAVRILSQFGPESAEALIKALGAQEASVRAMAAAGLEDCRGRWDGWEKRYPYPDPEAFCAWCVWRDQEDYTNAAGLVYGQSCGPVCVGKVRCEVREASLA